MYHRKSGIAIFHRVLLKISIIQILYRKFVFQHPKKIKDKGEGPTKSFLLLFNYTSSTDLSKPNSSSIFKTIFLQNQYYIFISNYKYWKKIIFITGNVMLLASKFPLVEKFYFYIRNKKT